MSFFPKDPWGLVESWVRPAKHIVPPESPQLGQIFEKLSTTTIIEADVASKGTQLKLKLTFEGGQQVLFKPML